MYSITNRYSLINPLLSISKQLEKKILRPQWYLVNITDNVTSDYKVVPLARRGNKPYGWRQHHRLSAIQQKINQCTNINNTQSNLCLITLTINPEGLSQKETWEIMKQERPKFQRIIKSKLQSIHCVTKLEAHRSGYCHAHLLFIFSKSFSCFKDKQNNFRNYFVSQLIKQKWTYGHSDVLFASNKKLTEYVTKEMGKYGQIEDTIKRVNAREHTVNDEKAIYTHYYADSLKMRILSVSRGLSEKIEQEGNTSECLVYNKTNSTRTVKLYPITFEKLSEILGYKPPPFTITKFSDIDKQKITKYLQSEGERYRRLKAQAVEYNQ